MISASASASSIASAKEAGCAAGSTACAAATSGLRLLHPSRPRPQRVRKSATRAVRAPALFVAHRELACRSLGESPFLRNRSFGDRHDRLRCRALPGRRRRARRLGIVFGRQFRRDASDGGVEGGGIGVDVAGVLERPDPLPEIRLGDIQELEHRRRNVAILFEQPVVDFLDVVGELAELVQAHHPAAALDRVELPARRAQCLAVAGIALELRAIFENGVENLVGLDEKDLEELGVEPIGIRREESLGFRRQRGSRRRDRRAALGDGGNGGFQRDGAHGVVGAGGLDLGQRLELGQGPLRLIDELDVVDQRGIVDQSP